MWQFACKNFARTVTLRNVRTFPCRQKSSATKLSQSGSGPRTWEERNGLPPVPFRKAARGTFFQEKPILGNVYKEDYALKSFLERLLPQSVYHEISPELERFGARVGAEIDALGLECDKNLPHHQPFDAWGNRVDELITSNAWKKQKIIAAEEGIVAIPYENKHGPWSRVHQVAKHMLYTSSSGLYSCPLAMTDGALQFFRRSPTTSSNPVFTNAFSRLMSRDPDHFWTSGQWMTERRGGSDVADGTETLAIPQADGTFKLYGYKWFSSATDADMTLTLARIVDEEGSYIKGTKGVSMFYLETRRQDGSLNGIEIQKLKDKLGTKQVPTAELLLDGTDAILASDPGRGVPGITPMLTITRLHNALSSASAMRKILLLARDYSLKRTAFGKLISDHPLHMQTLAKMEIDTRGAQLFVLDAARLLGLEETNQASEEESLLMRIVTPLLKLYTAKMAIATVSEGLESFGGQGYIEDTGLPGMLRDAQVLSIWEGTTNILSLDVLRSVLKSQGQTLQVFFKAVSSRLEGASDCNLAAVKEATKRMQQASSDVQGLLKSALSENPEVMEMAARDLAYSLSRLYIGSLLVEHASWSEATQEDAMVAQRWCEQDLRPVVTNYKNGHIGQTRNSDE
ncbi:Acyl-CoA dehydrogenase family member 11 [Holothuria leucospilota]|uniref:Acyl-CoA dehydrogenase family member 11 n=1 Tax=Holothuria leucospilota TaxID=206669 RepID=A0A9Q1HB61_HOLLE|nr:Acyl-CoA dehydrogenase family member 11 [Holothuria leucospilota]